MTSSKRGLLTRIGATMDAANEKLQLMGASLVQKVDVAASDAERGVGKARAYVEKGVRAASTGVRRTARSTEARASRAADKAGNAVKGAARRIEAETTAALGNVKRTVSKVEGDAARALGEAKRAVKGTIRAAATGAEKVAVRVEVAMDPKQPAPRRGAVTTGNARSAVLDLNHGRPTITASARRAGTPKAKAGGASVKPFARRIAKTSMGRRGG